MDDLISRQEAIGAIKTELAEIYDRDDEYECGYVLGVGKAKEIIERLPPAQPKRDHWIDLGFGFGKCSRCGNSVGNRLTMNFCPNCGSDMKGEQNETD